MDVRISEEVVRLYPDLMLAVVVARNLDNHGVNEELGSLMKLEQENARKLFASTSTIAQHASIAAWRDAYRRFNVGSDYRSSVEALVRRSVRGDPLPRINMIVDCYNVVSVKYLLPVGGEDLAKLQGDLELVRARGDEAFTALGQTVNDPPDHGEVIYRDAQGCICRRFNWRESDRTKLTQATRHGLLIIEGLPPAIDIELKEAADALGALLERFTGAHCTYFLMHAGRPSITISP